MKRVGCGKNVIGVVMALCLVPCLGVAPALAAGASSDATVERRLENLEAAMKEAKDGVLGSWADKIKFSGAVSVEAIYENLSFGDSSLEDEDSSDLVLSSVELGVDVDINKHVKGHVLLLWEEDDTEPVDLDEGYILLDGADVIPLYLKAGRMYLPFGKYETGMISDPITYDLGSLWESAVEVGVTYQGLYGSIFVFKGDVNEVDGEDHIDNFGAAVGYNLDAGTWTMDVGVGYVNNLYDSSGMSDAIDEDIAAAAETGSVLGLKDYVPGFAAHAIFTAAPFTFIGEYVTMLDDPEMSVRSLGITETTKADAIAAWNVEFGYEFVLAERDGHVAVAWQGSSEGGSVFPESRYIGTVGMDVWENVNCALEYLHNEYENDDEEDVVTADLTISF